MIYDLIFALHLKVITLYNNDLCLFVKILTYTASYVNKIEKR